MKQSPVKGKLNNFFSNLGKEAASASAKNDTFKAKRKQKVADRAKASPDGLTNFERRRAEKKSRKPGESKFKADIRRGKERRAKEKVAKAVEPRTDVLSKNIRDTSDLTVENRASLGEKVYPQQKSKPKVVKKKVVKKKVVENNDGPRVNKVEKKVITPKNIAEDIKPTPGPLNPKYMPKKGDKEMTLEEFKKITKTKSKSKSKKILSNIFKPGITLGKTLAKLYTIGK